jgi:hypothetical protein
VYSYQQNTAHDFWTEKYVISINAMEIRVICGPLYCSLTKQFKMNMPHKHGDSGNGVVIIGEVVYDRGNEGRCVMKRVFYVAAVLLLTSCIGMKTEIQVKRDLSGTVRLVYAVSQEFLDSGTLDGNENWPVLPVGRADFERTVARIDGLELRSYRERTRGGDRLFEVTLAFDGVSALAGFLDSGGQQLVYKQENGSHVFTVLFDRPDEGQMLEGGQPRMYDDQLAALARTAFAGYQFDFSIAVPGDEKTYSVPMADLLTSLQKEGLEIRF